MGNLKEKNGMLYIRANQGHSINGINEEELLTRITPNKIIHGTYKKAWIEHICHEGLSRMRRNHIHFVDANNLDKNMEIPGIRRSCDVFIFIDCHKCLNDGICFYRSDNDVILTSGFNGIIPITYFSKVIHVTTNQILYDGQQFTNHHTYLIQKKQK